MGASYTIQLGTFPNAPGGAGILQLSETNTSVSCGANAGPDVIVGELNGILNTTSSNGFDAISIGTTACNVGTQVLQWAGTTSNHPAIRQNLFKFKIVDGAGRFEHVGMSWLKHAFAAVSGSLCCTCTGGGGGLGVGCSDPYGAGTNGNQPNLGPNWQVNAHTGVFPFPPANPPWSGGTARRCQVPVNVLEATGASTTARFFGEGHYVSADDSAAGNQNNNASWTELNCVGTTEFSLGIISLAERGEPAIRAWSTLEPSVTISDVQVPADGLILVGSNVTDLGGGISRYEYAVYNMNADRNVGAFSVPVPAGALVSNIGFHDVHYHDGDGVGNTNVDGTDWVGVRTFDRITWACAPMALDPNANAIRWGTLYNFRFDANVSATKGIATIDLWKPGIPADMNVAAQVPEFGGIGVFCFGDGGGTPCPCGNNGGSARGCANSVFPEGALLSGAGNASVGLDTVRLDATSMSGGAGIFFQGDAQGPAMVIDDGLGCVRGNIVRLGVQGIAGGSSSYPRIGDAPISVRGAVSSAGGTYYYQCYYRNMAPTFCPPATSNRTSGVSVTWSP